MRIRTNVECDWRTDLYDRTAEHEDMTEDLAMILSTATVTIAHRTITGVEID